MFDAIWNAMKWSKQWAMIKEELWMIKDNAEPKGAWMTFSSDYCVILIMWNT